MHLSSNPAGGWADPQLETTTRTRLDQRSRAIHTLPKIDQHKVP